MTSFPSLESPRLPGAADVPLLTRHGPHCTRRGLGHSDAAKRISDTVMLHWTAGGWDGCVNRWLAFRLADGTGGMTIYATKRDAVRDQSDEFTCMYVCMVPGGMTVCDAEVLLRTHRQLYQNGYRLADKDARHGGRQFIMRLAGEHRLATIRALRQAR